VKLALAESFGALGVDRPVIELTLKTRPLGVAWSGARVHSFTWARGTNPHANQLAFVPHSCHKQRSMTVTGWSWRSVRVDADQHVRVSMQVTASRD
jgi:hypothetical protein